jgi:hypothetical protein
MDECISDIGSGEKVVVPLKYVEELRNKPEEEINNAKAHERVRGCRGSSKYSTSVANSRIGIRNQNHRIDH